VPIEQGLAHAATALEPAGVGGQHHLGVEVKLVAHLGLPLRGKVRRAQHREPLGAALRQQLGRDHQRGRGLAGAHVVGDQQAHGVEPQRHHQRHQLVRARLEVERAK
jgi:hypothetical protein